MRLRNLQLDFLPHQRAPKPLPLSPLNIAVANDKAKNVDVTLATPEPPLVLHRVQDNAPDIIIDTASTGTSSFTFPSFPAPPSSPALLPFPSLVTPPQTPSKPVELARRRKMFEKVNSSQLTSQEQAKIESWVSQCPSLRRVCLSGMIWYSPLWLPAFQETSADLPRPPT